MSGKELHRIFWLEKLMRVGVGHLGEVEERCLREVECQLDN
jgi:hypothetical protein